jgi:hypothetical protein
VTTSAQVGEKDWLAWIVATATIHGWLVTRYEPAMANGYPKLTLCRAPDLLFVHPKTDKGSATAAQQAWLDELTRSGVYAQVWRPCDEAAVTVILTAGLPKDQPGV